jgi:hypothetical protein
VDIRCGPDDMFVFMYLQEMLGIPLLGAIPEDPQVRLDVSPQQNQMLSSHWTCFQPATEFADAMHPRYDHPACIQTSLFYVPAAWPHLLAQVIVATNRGEPLVLQKKLTLSGIAYENAARRLVGKQVRHPSCQGPGPPPARRLCWSGSATDTCTCFSRDKDGHVIKRVSMLCYACRTTSSTSATPTSQCGIV